MRPYENEELRAVCGLTLRPGGLALTREALALAAFAPSARLLDLGCGPGGTLKFLREAGFEALGLDKSPALLAEAGQYGPVLEADFHALPLEDGSFDGVFCECVLSLSPEPAKVLGECARVLKNGGRLIVSDLFVCQADFFGQLAAAGLALRENLDRSQYLKELAARLVWHSGSADILEKLWGSGCARSGRAAYYLLIAEKKAESRYQ